MKYCVEIVSAKNASGLTDEFSTPQELTLADIRKELAGWQLVSNPEWDGEVEQGVVRKGRKHLLVTSYGRALPWPKVLR